MYKSLAIVFGVVVTGCVDEPNDLLIERSDAGGVAGRFATAGGDVRFEAAGDTARFFTDSGAILAARFPGETQPAEWSTAEPPAELLAALPRAAAALDASELDRAAIEPLLDLAVEAPSADAGGRPDEGSAGYSASIWFGRNCGTLYERGWVGGENWELYSRYATVTFYFNSTTISSSRWVNPRSIQFWSQKGRYLSSAYATGGGRMTFYNAGNSCE